MAIKPIDHYSITNIKPSVYNEEAMTALELVGRIGQRLNEAIAAYNELEEGTTEKLTAFNEFINTMNDVTMPAEVKKEIDAHIARGDFDQAINIYLGNLEQRVDNLLNTIPEGSTTMDAEVIDARVGGDGVEYDNAGNAIRGQYNDLKITGDDKLSVVASAYGYKYNLNRPSMWVQGWLDPETGEHGTTGNDYARFICTRDFIPANVERVISPELRLVIYVYTLGGAFSHVEELRRADYTFDHTAHKYKINATGGDPVMTNFQTTKTDVTVDECIKIYFVSGQIVNPNDDVNVTALKAGYQKNINYRSLWSQGYIYGSTGEDGINPRGYDYWFYSRSDYLPESVQAVAVKSGCKGRLFRYSSSGEFVDNIPVSVTPVTLNNNSYLYRFDVTYTKNTVDVKNPVGVMWDNVLLLSELAPDQATGTVRSPFDKGADFATINYRADYTGFGDACSIQSTSDEIYAYFDDMVDSFPDYASSMVIGKTVNNQILKSYRFKFPDVIGPNVPRKPKIVIIAGQHGFEKSNVVGLTNLMSAICTVSEAINKSTNTALNYFLCNLEIVVVPIVNRDGYDANTYVNANGVNLNRNYGYKWVKVSDTSSSQYGGEAAFDQPETQAIRDLIQSEGDIDLVIDSHTRGSGAVSEKSQCNWIAVPGEMDEYFARLRYAIKNHLTSFSHFMTSEITGEPPEQYGYYQGIDGTINTTPSLDNWCTYIKKISSLTLEGFNALPGATIIGDSDVIYANAVIIANFIAHYCEEYSRKR